MTSAGGATDGSTLAVPVAGAVVDSPSEPADLLGKAGHGSLPIWLNPERFIGDEFSPEECVADLRRFVSQFIQTCKHTYSTP